MMNYFFYAFLIKLIKNKMYQNCSFCLQPCVVHCMNRSLHHKHNEQDDKSGQIINELLSRQKTSSYIKYVEMIIESDKRECFSEYLKGDPCRQQFDHLQQYYKFRIYVPLFAKSRASDTVLHYYYEKLKHYYNNIKRKLHLTVDPSSSSDFSSLTQSNISTKEELLKDIKYELELDKKRKVPPSIMTYKSQSKALEELVSYLKLNSRFEHVKTLKTEDCFNEQELFEETAKKRHNGKFLFQQPLKVNIKSKLFKKQKIDSSSGRKTPIPNDSNRDRPPSRSKSIKIIKCRQIKQITIQTEKNSKLASPFRIREQQILRESRSNNALSKRHSSLGKLNQQHYSSPASPYKRKSLTKEKGKTSSTSVQAKFKNQTIEPLKLKNEEKTKLKESIMKIQMMKFQNEVIKNKTTPNSPSTKKVMKQQFQVMKNDNILSIRKKKLQILKQKVHKK